MHRVVSMAAARIVLCIALGAAPAALAQGYPQKPIRTIVPFPAGGIADASPGTTWMTTPLFARKQATARVLPPICKLEVKLAIYPPIVKL